MDWNKCIFCQSILRSCPTCCPADSKRQDVGCGYKSLAKDIDGYMSLGEFPAGIDLSLWDEGDGLETTLKRNKACWHRKCRNKYLHVTKLNRLRVLDAATNDNNNNDVSQRFCESDSDSPCLKQPRITRGGTGHKKPNEGFVCFFL